LVLGLLSDLPCKNCSHNRGVGRGGQPARHAAPAVPDADAVRDDVREHVVEHL
jgi:hypothetical protein